MDNNHWMLDSGFQITSAESPARLIQLRAQNPKPITQNFIRTAAPPWDRPSTRGTMGIYQGSGRSDVVLRLIIAGFAAVGAVVLAVFGEPDAEFRMAQGAVSVALATFFRLITNRTDKYFSRHMRVLLLPPRQAGEIASRPDRPQPAAGAAQSGQVRQKAQRGTKPLMLLIGKIALCAQLPGQAQRSGS